MKNKVRVLKLKGGITVTITMTKKRYEILIVIPEEMQEKEINIRNREIVLYVKRIKNHMGLIRVNLQAEYKVDNYGQINIKRWSKFEFKEDSCYSGSISLSPNCYIPTNIRKSVKKYWDAYKKNSKLIKEIPSSNRVSTSSKFTNYSNNNAARPYSGGKVSPK